MNYPLRAINAPGIVSTEAPTATLFTFNAELWFTMESAGEQAATMCVVSLSGRAPSSSVVLEFCVDEVFEDRRDIDMRRIRRGKSSSLGMPKASQVNIQGDSSV